MKTIKLLSILVLSFSSFTVKSQYYNFPFPGWNQSFTGVIWNGIQDEIGLSTISFDRDTLIGNKIYFTDGSKYFRSENGRVYQYFYDWSSQKFKEEVEFDFTLNVGNYFHNYYYSAETVLMVIAKKRELNLVGDSILRIDLEVRFYSQVKDTIVG